MPKYQDEIRELLHDGCPVALTGGAPFGCVNVFTSHRLRVHSDVENRANPLRINRLTWFAPETSVSDAFHSDAS